MTNCIHKFEFVKVFKPHPICYCKVYTMLGVGNFQAISGKFVSPYSLCACACALALINNFHISHWAVVGRGSWPNRVYLLGFHPLDGVLDLKKLNEGKSTGGTYIGVETNTKPVLISIQAFRKNFYSRTIDRRTCGLFQLRPELYTHSRSHTDVGAGSPLDSNRGSSYRG